MVHCRLMPKIMAGEHSVGESSSTGGEARAEEGGATRDMLSLEMTSAENVSPPQVGMRLEKERSLAPGHGVGTSDRKPEQDPGGTEPADAAAARAGAEVVRQAWDR